MPVAGYRTFFVGMMTKDFQGKPGETTTPGLWRLMGNFCRVRKAAQSQQKGIWGVRG